MTTDKDPFDDAIRRKLQGASIPPPEGVFEQVVPQKKERRRLLYWLLPMLLIPGAFILIDKQTPEAALATDQVTELSIVDKNNALPVKQNTSLTDNINSTEQSAAVSTNAFKSESEIAGNASTGSIASANSDQSSDSDYRNANTNNYKNNRNPNTKSKSKHSNSTHARKESGFSGAYGKLPFTQGFQQIYVYPITPLSSGLSVAKPQQVLHKPLAGPPQSVRQASKFSIEISAAYLIPDLKYDAISNDTMETRIYSSLRSGDYQTKGYSFELSGNLKLKDRWTVGASLSFANQKETATFLFNESYYFDLIDTTQYYILYPFTPPVLYTVYDTILSTATEIQQMKHEITFQSATFSVYARYTLPLGRFTFEPQAGAGTAIYTTIRGTSNLNKDFETRSGSEVFKSNPEIHISGAVGLTYAFSERFNLLFRTGYTYGITSFANSDQANVSSNQFSTGIGLRWNFFSNQATKSTHPGSDIVKQ